MILASGAAVTLPALAPFAASEVAGLESGLLTRVFGQDHVIAAVAGAIRRSTFGTPVADGPVSFLFLGPRGVGKTQLAKAVAEQLFGTETALLHVDLTKRVDLSVDWLVEAASQRRVILLDEVDRADNEAVERMAWLLRGDMARTAAGLRGAIVILTSGAATVGRTLPSAPPDVRRQLLASIHETVTFRQIDWRQFRPRR